MNRAGFHKKEKDLGELLSVKYSCKCTSVLIRQLANEHEPCNTLLNCKIPDLHYQSGNQLTTLFPLPKLHNIPASGPMNLENG